MDVTVAEHWAAEAFEVWRPRTYFNPTNNQLHGLGDRRRLGSPARHPGRQTVTVNGDGGFLMSAVEISTAARECLPVKFFVLDDQAYHFMQAVQKPIYLRTTATILARLDYGALAKALGVAYQEIRGTGEIEAGIGNALSYDGPILTRVVTDYSKRPIRWLEATRQRFLKDLSTEQKIRFAARVGSRYLERAEERLSVPGQKALLIVTRGRGPLRFIDEGRLQTSSCRPDRCRYSTERFLHLASVSPHCRPSLTLAQFFSYNHYLRGFPSFSSR